MGTIDKILLLITALAILLLAYLYSTGFYLIDAEKEQRREEGRQRENTQQRGK
jgi:hypothetical protein